MDTIKKLAVNNFRAILNSTTCGCFSCLEIFSPREVATKTGEKSNWREEENGRTAICPKCGKATVLGDGAEEIENIDTNFLKKVFEGEIE